MKNIQSELYFKTATSDFELQSCYRLRFQVYCQEKQWLAPSKFPKGLEIDEYDAKAVHVIAMDEDFKVVGLMRILRESDYIKLPFVDHPAMKDRQIVLPNMAELSRFVITATHNRSLVLKGLLRAIYQVSRKIDVENWMFVSEPSMIRLLGKFHYYFEPITNPAMYYGGFTLIAHCNAASMENRWKRTSREILEFNQTESGVLYANSAVA